MDVETQALVDGLRHRNPDALSQVFELYANKIYRLAFKLLHDEQQADGVVQDTFIKLIQHIDNFEGRSKIGTWLYRVAYNEAQQRIRRTKKHIEFGSLDESPFLPECLIDWKTIPEQQLNSDEAIQQMQIAINQLSDSLKAVFILRDIEELSTHDTADILGITESAVKVRLHRARLTLREKLATYFKEYITP